MIQMRLIGSALIALLLLAAPAWAESGEMLFNENCVGCHQVGGTGVPGEYPRLAGRTDVIAANAKGRAFLTRLMVTGMHGDITVDGRRILGIMPDFADLKDGELAAILNYVVGLEGGKATPFRPQEVTKSRLASRSTPEQLAEIRNHLSGARVIP